MTSGGAAPWPEEGRWTAERYEAWVEHLAGVEDGWQDRRWARLYRQISEQIVGRPEGRGRTTAAGSDSAESGARALVFGQRTALVLDALMEPGWAQGRSVVDAGAGTGPVALVALAAGAARVTSLEVGAGEHRWLERARRACPRPEDWRLERGAIDARAIDPGRGDTWIFAYSFMEMTGGRGAAGRSALRRLLDAGCRVLLLEAGTRNAAHHLADLRDGFPDDVRRPCRGARVCPRGSGQSSWCHFTWKLRLGPGATRVVQAGGRRTNLTHFSFLELASGTSRSSAQRLIEVQRRGRRCRVLHLCGPSGEAVHEVGPKPRATWDWAEGRVTGELLGLPDADPDTESPGSRRLEHPLPTLGSVRST